MSLAWKVIPMPITLGGKTFHHHYDYREMSSRDFYDAIRAGAEVSTAQINLLTYLRAFLPPLRAGKDIVYLCFSSGLSGTIQTARHGDGGAAGEVPPAQDHLCGYPLRLRGTGPSGL